MTDPIPNHVHFANLCDALARGQDMSTVLPGAVLDSLASAPGLRVMTDFAGRDSVAAAMAWLREHQVGVLIPIADVVPTRHGSWAVYDDNWKRLKGLVQRVHPDVRVTPWFCLEDVDFWRMLNGRFSNELAQTFGFFTPCLGCHLHFYAMRSILARALDARVLISGEKEFHGSRRKANQTVEAVEAYRSFSAANGVEQHFPIHGLQSEEVLLELLGDDWQENDRQLGCVMSGNDSGADGRPLYRPEQIAAYMARFAAPLAQHILKLRLAGVGGSDFTQAVVEQARKLLVENRAR